MNLEECRARIDKIDARIVELYEERLAVSEDIARAKAGMGKAVFDPEREKLKLEKVRGLTKQECNKDGVEELFVFLMNKSKERQNEALNS